MHSPTLARGIAAGAVLIAAALVLVARAPSDGPRGLPADVEPAPAHLETPADDGSDSAPLGYSPAAAKVRELEAMSETFRNTTFVIAIRDAGYVCHQLQSVYGGLDDSAKWLASCSDMLAYTIGVGSDGSLRIDPTLQYLDGVTRGVRELIEPRDEVVLPPQEAVPEPR